MTAEVVLAHGEVLAKKYRLLERIGEGATAEVWLALNLPLDVKVAIKILRASLSTDPRLVSRVQREAKATAAIAHKNIVQVFDYGVTSWGSPFIVMERLKGETLAARLGAAGRLAPREAARILLRAMKGVTVAHAKGIIHRDLKPENVFLAIEDNGAERPKVLDFGVSHVLREGAEERSRTGTGPVGTPAYLPPEVILEDKRGDAQGDVWALGVMLYECIAGELPFVGEGTHQVLEAVCHRDPPRLAERAAGVDAELEAIVARALAKSAADRYPGVRELFDDLNHWLGAKESAVTTSLPRMSALPPDPMLDEEVDTLIGPSLEERVSFHSSPAPPTASSRPSMRAARVSRPSSPWTTLVAVAVVAALGVAGYSLLVRAPRESRPAAPAVAAPASVAAPTLDVVGLPSGSSVTVDGEIVTLPARLRRGSVVTVRVDAPGYLPWTQTVQAEGSVKLVFSGQARPAPSPSPSASAPVPRTAPKIDPRVSPNYKDVPY
ncbi:MAG: serine/threonine protein kinase [Polyangiaceae bacterium]|nr:serine/threonine protein kinase [Polyangiaceae bacterium]